jgi:hypothetical protein
MVFYISPSAGISATLSAALTGNALTVSKEIGMFGYSCLEFYVFLLHGVAADVEKCLITEV